MKNLVAVMLSLFIGCYALAEEKSPLQRMNGVGNIDLSTLVHLRPPVKDFDGNERAQVNLITPHRTLRESQLLLSEKRSIVLIEDLENSGLEPQLTKRIKKIVSNKWDRGYHFDKTGLENFHIIGNFVHHVSENGEPSFFVAIIPKSVSVEKIIFQVEWFGEGVGAHTQIRMILDQPIIAIPQWDDDYTPHIISNNGKGDLIYSLQAARVEGGQKDWSPVLGFMGEYANALQMFSVQSKAKKQIYSAVVEQYKVEGLSPSQKKSIFLKALTTSDKLQESTIYNTIFNSCVTHALLALRGETNIKTKAYEGISQINPIWFNPYTILDNLKKVGVQLSAMETMNSEFRKKGFDQYGQIFTESMRRESKGYKLTAPLEETIISNESFEQLIRKIAFYIIDNKISAEQFINFVNKSKESFENGMEENLSNPKVTSLAKEIKSFWESNFPDQPIENFFKALTSAQSLNTSGNTN